MGKKLKCTVIVQSILSVSNKSMVIKNKKSGTITVFGKISTSFYMTYDARYISISRENIGDMRMTFKITAKRKGKTYLKIKNNSCKKEIRVNIRIK